MKFFITTLIIFVFYLNIITYQNVTKKLYSLVNFLVYDKLGEKNTGLNEGKFTSNNFEYCYNVNDLNFLNKDTDIHFSSITLEKKHINNNSLTV